MKIIYNIIKLLILLLLLVLAVCNTQTVQFFYLPGQEVSLPLIVVLFGAFIIGVLFGLFALFGRLLVLRSENNRLRAEVKKNARLTENDLVVPTTSQPAVSASTSVQPVAPTVAHGE